MKEKKDYLIIYLVEGAPSIVSQIISIFIKEDVKLKEENKVTDENYFDKEWLKMKRRMKQQYNSFKVNINKHSSIVK